jgi:hypothetical protein
MVIDMIDADRVFCWWSLFLCGSSFAFAVASTAKQHSCSDGVVDVVRFKLHGH